jgi:Undecaprenyl-phosphate galactose phosphotransferase WbaP
MNNTRVDERKIHQTRLKTIKHYRLQMGGLMLLADLGGFGLTGLLVYLLNRFLHFFVFELSDVKYLVVVLLCLALFMSSRLYPGVGINPADEIKMVTQFVSTSLILGLVLFMIVEPGWKLNYLALLPAWVISILLLLGSRWSVRILAVRLKAWGEPVVVIGKGPQMQRLAEYFIQRRRLGFVPVLAASGSASRQAISATIPMIDLNKLASFPDDYFSRDDIQTALIDLSTVSNVFQPEVSHSLFRLFRQVIFISDVDWLEGASLGIRDFEGMMGMEARKTAITTTEKAVKRGLDIGVSFIGGLLLLPFFVALAVLIKLDSPGPALYSQERVGKGRKRIKIYKFRSMQQNADQALADCLVQDPEAKLEWDQTQKLKDDPRLTRVGKFLRKFSLDEFPQLWNILKGDMSLVGPRPMLPGQEGLYGETLPVYCRVRPGLSGLWQVSGRNQTTFNERAKFDYHYVHNWSIWLDIYILLRTIWVVLSRDGAY